MGHGILYINCGFNASQQLDRKIIWPNWSSYQRLIPFFHSKSILQFKTAAVQQSFCRLSFPNEKWCSTIMGSCISCALNFFLLSEIPIHHKCHRYEKRLTFLPLLSFWHEQVSMLWKNCRVGWRIWPKTCSTLLTWMVPIHIKCLNPLPKICALCAHLPRITMQTFHTE